MTWRKTNPLSGQLLQIAGVVRMVGTSRRDAARHRLFAPALTREGA